MLPQIGLYNILVEKCQYQDVNLVKNLVERIVKVPKSREFDGQDLKKLPVRTFKNQLYEYEGEWQSMEQYKRNRSMENPFDQIYREDSLIHGYGRMKWIQGMVYQGNFVNGYRSGLGVMYYKNGDVYIGFWKNNLKKGQGIQCSFNQLGCNMYIGEWSMNNQRGKGMLLTANGDSTKSSS